MAVTIITPTRAPVQVHERAHVAVAPWHIYAVLFATTSIVVGVIWDISWHMTIGRDTFWTPAHLAIYLGGVVGGLASGVVVLRTTFAGSLEEKARAVRFWGFRGPLGSWVSIWGALAMITSAPFDDWWHNAYGLDVEILSPPHTLLALGMFGIALGAMLSVLALQNRATDEREEQHYSALLALAAGLLLTMLAIMTYEYSERVLMHSAIFYEVLCPVFAFALTFAARASKLRFGATAAALVYMVVTAAMTWILPLFEATPKLGPIYQNVTHMVPMSFPLLIVVPAAVMDVAMQLADDEQRSDWLLAAVLGVAFFGVFVVTQWSFANFLISRSSTNWFFATDNFPYFLPSTSSTVRRVFVARDATEGALRVGLVVAALLSVVTARLALWVGAWMRRVRR
jgi:hypothetical protein